MLRTHPDTAGIVVTPAAFTVCGHLAGASALLPIIAASQANNLRLQQLTMRSKDGKLFQYLRKAEAPASHLTDLRWLVWDP